MNLVKLNSILYKTISILMSGFLVLICIGELVMHLYLRSLLGILFAIIIAFKTKKIASVKSWVFTIILFIIALAIVDLYVTEQSPYFI